MKHIIITASLLFGSVALAQNSAPIGPGSGGGAVQTVTACTPWTPTDQSGASLTFSSVSAQYCVYGNFVFAYGTLTYPATSNTDNAVISLPVPVPNQSYAAVPGMTFSTALYVLRTVPGSSTAGFFSSVGVAETNLNVTAKTINFIVIYPAS